MFGCLGKIIKIIIVILAVIGFVAIGGVTFFKDFFNKSFFKSDSVLQKASKTADFSNLDSEFELVSSAKLPKIGNYVYVRHGASSQKFYFLLTSNNNVLTKDDFNSHKYEEKITAFIKNFKILQFENFEITGISDMKALNQNIPYAKFKADINNLPLNYCVQGIIASAEKNDENLIIIAINGNGKYSQIITDALLEKIK